MIGASFDLPPEMAVRFFRQKGLAPTFDHRDMLGDEHAKAFTVAKMMQVDLLADVKEALDQAIADGTALRDFIEQLTPILQAKGWWGRQEVTDPETGNVITAQLGSAYRLETIFRTNMQTSYAAGQWQKIEETKDEAPYLLYDAIDDGRTRHSAKL